MKKYFTIITSIFLISIWACPVTAYEVEGIDIHGFISQGFIKSSEYNYLTNDSKDGSFAYNEMGINFSKELTEKLRLGLQLFSRDLGDVANNKIAVDWGYADYRYKDWLGIRAGKIKLSMGLYNETRDLDMLRTPIVLPQGIYNDFLRDNLIATSGVGIYGNFDLNAFGGISYQLSAGVPPSSKDDGAGKYLENLMAGSGVTLLEDFDPGTSYAGSLWWETPLEGLRIGYSYLHSDKTAPLELPAIPGVQPAMSAMFEYTEVNHIVSAEYTYDALTVAVEYMERNMKNRLPPFYEDSPTLQSYYILVSYAFNDWFTLGCYYSESYPDKDDKDGATTRLSYMSVDTVDHLAWEKDIALTFRFDLNEYWVLKIEGHRVNGTANTFVVDNRDNSYSDSDNWYGAAKVTFSF